jgi:hypothetical protein
MAFGNRIDFDTAAADQLSAPGRRAVTIMPQIKNPMIAAQ